MSRLELQVIDTRTFQRLKKYRQLGMSHLVYPSANHTRFEHSLGVLKKVQEMMECVENNLHSEDPEKKISSSEKRIARLAALLHDCSNIAYGHTLEDETCVVQTHQEDKERIDSIVGPGTEIGDILQRSLDPSDFDLLLRVLSAKKDPLAGEEKRNGVTYTSELGEKAFLVDLIKNTVCADLLDYLARDTYFCNLPLAVPDRFLRYLYLHVSERQKRLAIRLWHRNENRPRPSIVSELVQLLETRYYLAERVYFHHAKTITSAMLSAAVWYALHFAQQKDRLTVQRLCEMGDEELLLDLQKEGRPEISRKLARSLSIRQLYEKFYRLPRDRIERYIRDDHLRYLKQKYHDDANGRTSEEEALCEWVGLEPGNALIYCPDPEMSLKAAEMNVTSPNGIGMFCNTVEGVTKDKTDSILESHKSLWALEVFVAKGALVSQHKRDLLYQWCAAKFEPSDATQGGRAMRQALGLTIDDILREDQSAITPAVRDELVEDAMSPAQKRRLTREYLRGRIQNITVKNELRSVR